jgi:[glutamine synthetase] adenylyltransferase / [glutamine synthetase]-adenylyl-L-tyrosine phosphorylase
MENINDAIARADANSPFLSGLIARQPALVDIIRAGDFDAALAAAFTVESQDPEQQNTEQQSIAQRLRKIRYGTALVTAIADLSGSWDLARVTATLSDFADIAVDTAIAAAIEERVPGASNQGFTVIALGKHGGRELNYSSDIDPIFLFDPKTIARRQGEDAQESAVRIGKRVIDLLGTVTADGYVFRVDMRLRPSPEVSPVALPVEAAIGYYESSALAWEQAAFIRARVCAGDMALGGYFMDSIRSFIWRRSIDFGQLKNIQTMSAQIRDHYSRGQNFGPGYDLKRGRGGIRECEFYGQAHQLIHGGRNAALRMADTRSALSALAGAGHIGTAEADALSQSYALLRSIEHRLQMIDDQQTHSIPKDSEAIDRVARLHGVSGGGALLDLLRPHIERVQAIYDHLTAGDGGDGGEVKAYLPEDSLPLEDQLSAMGYDDAPAVMQRIGRWRSGKLRAIRSQPARDAFETVLPAIMNALAKSPDPSRALARFDNMIEALPSAVNFFHLLGARPGLLQLIGDVLSYAPVLAEALGRRTELLDGLIDASALDAPKDADALADEMMIRTKGLDYQSVLDQVRAYVGEHRFAYGVQLIEGRHDALTIARGYAHLAEAAIRVLTEATVKKFETAHGKMPDGEIVILALGRLGGEALTHASDLDLILLFNGQFDTESDGAKPLGATQYYNRLAQRVVAALSVPTAAGALYDVDTRLRPSGAQGLLCVSVDSFAKYQHSDAWVWEHMALTRARPVFGSAAACAQVSAIIADVLKSPRDNTALITDILAMRGDIAAHKPPKGTLDIKLLSGGLVDAEFVIHTLQLQSGQGLYASLPKAADDLAKAGLLPSAFCSAQDLLTRLLIILRLVAPDLEIPPPASQQLIARCLHYKEWPDLMAAVEHARAIVLDEYTRILGPRNF